MNSNKKVVPEAKSALDKFKMEVANEVGVNLKDGYNGDITAKEAGSIGGQMVNLMMPEHQWKFRRTNRRAYGHCTDIVMTMQAGI
ncbi:MAG: alpha/beta-type small acid-soluble spore protein [Ruminococcaceae bacterium]|nr:alpha/beta-type small acid-soluble spore protein [Oscillospiraceae bacterium]